jgi:hypothetical protein
MKKSGREPRPVGIGAHLEKIAELGDWRGETSAECAAHQESSPDVVEEWKWMGTPIGRTTASSALANPQEGRSLLSRARL